MNPVTAEFIRQALRWVGVYALTVGAPPWLADMLGDPAFVDAAIGFGSYAVAEIWWAVSKWRGKAVRQSNVAD